MLETSPNFHDWLYHSNKLSLSFAVCAAEKPDETITSCGRIADSEPRPQGAICAGFSRMLTHGSSVSMPSRHA
jgi:hypothetical protein